MQSLLWLWIISVSNLIIGGVIWFSNQDEQVTSFGRVDEDAVFWTAIGGATFNFGALVLVIALATQAVVTAVEANARKG